MPQRARAGILPRMTTLDRDALAQWARLAGFEWGAAELEAIAGPLARALESLGRLEQLPLRDVEPLTQYRML